MYIHMVPMIDEVKPEIQEAVDFKFPCLCAAVRKAGRVLTAMYDRRLKPGKLRITQFSLLANIGRNPGIAVSELARLLAMDQTTVTRNLQVLEKAGYVGLAADTGDQRIKRIGITDSGKAEMDEVRPLWEEAQAEIESVLGREGVEELLRLLKKISD